MMRWLTLLVAAVLFAAFQLPGAGSASAPAISSLDASEIATSYDHLTGDFYKKVNRQSILDGVRAELLAAMKHEGVKDASLPRIVSRTDASNVSAIDLEVNRAARESGAKISPQLLSYVAMSGMLKSVKDRWTVFLTPRDYAQLNGSLDGGDFGGTGIVIQQDDATKYIGVSNVVPDGPADKAGIQQDDLIEAINGVSTKGMTIVKASSLLRGKQGTKVTLTIFRNGSPFGAPLVLTRATIHQISVFSKMLPGKIGYVQLSVFGRTTGAELATALERLQKQGMRAVIMDLRDNGGGYLDAAVAVSSQFISSGPIVSVESRASSITTLEADGTAIAPVPLAVLVNQYTASASEITSGAIQDSGVGTIIGKKTFGKGVVQTIFPLPDKSAIKITTARYLTPHNRDINHLGITPDIAIAENKGARFGDPAKDQQLRRAIEFVTDRIAHLDAQDGTPTPAPGN